VWCRSEDQGAQIRFGSVSSPCLVVSVFLHSSLSNSLSSLLVTGCSNVYGKRLPNVVLDKRFGGLCSNCPLDGYSFDYWLDDIIEIWNA